MNSLSAQLANLATPQTDIYNVERKRVSLLFDDEAAGGLDRESVLAIGVAGLDELALMDESLLSAKETLFSETAANVQRATMSTSANESLSATIRAFLFRLSPFMTLKPARSALEWLIYRYDIVHHERDTLLRLSLVYHDTNVFCRLLAIIPLDPADDTYGWLAQCKTARTPLARRTLIERCRRRPALLGHLFGLIDEATTLLGEEWVDAKMNTMFTFVTGVAIGVMGEGVDEAIVSIVMPHIARGLTGNLKSRRCASLMMLCSLVRAVQLSEETLEGVITLLLRCARESEPSTDPSLPLTTLLAVCQRHDIDALPSKVLMKLVRKHEHFHLCEQLRSLAARSNITPFSSAALRTIIGASAPKTGTEEFVVTLVDTIVGDEKACRRLCTFIMKRYVKDGEAIDEWVRRGLRPVLRALLTRYPAQFDKLRATWESKNAEAWAKMLIAAEIADHEMGLAVQVNGHSRKREAEGMTDVMRGLMPSAKHTKLDVNDVDLPELDASPIDVLVEGCRKGETKLIDDALAHMSDYFVSKLSSAEGTRLATTLFSAMCPERQTDVASKSWLDGRVTRVMGGLPLPATALHSILAMAKRKSTRKVEGDDELLSLPSSSSVAARVARLGQIKSAIATALRFKSVSDATEYTVQALFAFINVTIAEEGADEELKKGGVSTDERNHTLQLSLDLLLRLISSSPSIDLSSCVRVDVLSRVLYEVRQSACFNLGLDVLTCVAEGSSTASLMEMLPLFAGMCTRQGIDDSFTFVLVDRAVRSITKAICRRAAMQTMAHDTTTVPTVTLILEQLVGVYGDMPVHRREHIFAAVASSAGEGEEGIAHVLAQMALLVARVLVDKHKDDDTSCASVLGHFSAVDQLGAVEQIMRVAHAVVFRVDAQIVPRSLAALPSARSQAFLSMCTALCLHAIEDDALVSKLADMSDASLEEEIAPCAATIFELLLASHESIDKMVKSLPLDDRKAALESRQRLVLLLNALKRLLPTRQSLVVMEKLLGADSAYVRVNAVDLLNVRLGEQPSPFDHSHIPPLLRIARRLTSWMADDDRLLAKVSANSLRLFVRVLRDSDIDLLTEICTRCSTVIHAHHTQPECRPLVGNAALCAAEAVIMLGVHVVPVLPALLAPLIDICQRLLLEGEGGEQDTQLVNGVPLNELYTSSMLTTLTRVVCATPQYCSAELPRLIRLLCRCAEEGAEEKVTHREARGQLVDRLTHLRHRIATLDSRVLLKAMGQCVEESTDDWVMRSFACRLIVEHVTISHFDGKKSTHFGHLGAHVVALQDMVFAALPLRSRCVHEMEPQCVDRLEAYIVRAFTQTALRSSQTQLQPCMQRVVDWYTVGVEEGGKEVHRVITAYSLATMLATELKSLFVLVAPLFVPTLADVMERCHMTMCPKAERLFAKEDAQHAHTLLREAFRLLVVCADGDVLGEEEQTKRLAVVLVDQLSNTRVPSYAERVADGLRPAIASLAAALVNDDSHLRAINYALLLHTRDTKAIVRLSSLSCASSMYSALSSHASPLLPETAPFIAELFEDDDAEVQLQCHKLVKQLQTILGENVEQFF